MNFKNLFDSDPANTKQKQGLIKIGVVAGVGLAFWLIASVFGGASDAKNEEDKKQIGEFKIVDETHSVKSSFIGDVKDDMHVAHKDAKQYANESEKLRKEIEELKEAQEQMKGQMGGGNQQATPFTSPANQNNPLGANSYPQPPRVQGQQFGEPFPTGIIAGGSNIGQGNIPPLPPQMPPRAVKQYKPMTESDFFGSDIEQKAERTGKKTNPTANKIVPRNLLSSGTIMKVRLLSGLDAPTLAKAKKAPLPILMQVSNLGILPNRYKYDVEQCFILGEGYGDLSSERVYIRVTTLSCITKDGRHIDGELSGFIAGEDGKNGMRGRVVTKQGAILARTALAGFLGGVANGLNMQNQTITASALGTTASQTPGMSPSDITKMGVFAGLGKATERLSDFYMDLADELTPVIEISANRQADVIVTELKNMLTLEDEESGTSKKHKPKNEDADEYEDDAKTNKHKVKTGVK